MYRHIDVNTLIAHEAAAGHPLWVARPIDRHLAEHCTDLDEPWRDSFLAWAGPALADAISDGSVELCFHAGRVAARIRRRPDAFAALRESPVGGVLHGLEIFGDNDEIRAMIAQLRDEQPWLRRLAVASLRLEGPALDLHALGPLLPRLDELALYGHRVATRIPSGVRTLRLTGCDALALAAPLPSVEHLDLAQYPWSEPLPMAVASRRWLPSLVGLDLSRSDPPASFGRYVLDFAELARLDVLPGLAELRLPSLRYDDDVDTLRNALAQMPASTRVSLARAYDGLASRCSELADDPRIEIPPGFPFPPYDQVWPLELSIDDYFLKILGIIEYLEIAWTSLGTPAQEAWRAFWRFLDDLTDDGASDEEDGNGIDQFPRATLITALDACEDMGGRWYRDLLRSRPLYIPRADTGPLWIGLLRELRSRPGGDTLTVQWL